MPNYSDVAVQAALKLGREPSISAREAWNYAAIEAFPNSESMQSKGCPKTTFLTVCASGALVDFPKNGTVRDTANAKHARDCLTLIARDSSYIEMDPRRLWEIVTHGSGKAYNEQMHVILGLARARLLRQSPLKDTSS